MRNNVKVLVVEDELLIAWDIKYLLEESNYNTSVVKDYTSAIEQIELNKPDIILIDVYLGRGKNGIDLGFLLSNQYKIPFIYLTSYNDKKTVDEIILTKPFAFITKPYKKVDLIASIQIALNINLYNLNNKSDFNLYSDVPFVIKKVINFINENIESKIEIDDLVKLTKWSKHHFIRIFTSEMGISPYSFILKIKIDHAKKMILDENNKLENIAYDLGFHSYINFARTFKNYTKLSPKEFRKINNIHII